MSKAIAVCHGAFGRTALYRLNRPLNLHAHREGHLIFHIHGERAGMTVSGVNCQASADEAVAINPWEPHSFTPTDRAEGALFLTLYIDPRWFCQAGNQDMRFGATTITVTHEIDRAVKRITGLLRKGERSDRFDGNLLELTQACFEQSRGPNTQSPRDYLNFSDFRLRRSIKLMRDNLDGEMELDGIAREAGLSRPHFFRLFRRETGLTPNLFLNTLRMEKAIDSLTQTDSAVSDIGYDLGFSCQSSFTRFFAANAGLSPSDYRRVARHVGSEAH